MPFLIGVSTLLSVVFSILLVVFLKNPMLRFIIRYNIHKMLSSYTVVFGLVLTFGNMTSGDLRAKSLSTITNLDAGQDDSNYNFSRHWQYCVLCIRAFYSFLLTTIVEHVISVFIFSYSFFCWLQ